MLNNEKKKKLDKPFISLNGKKSCVKKNKRNGSFFLSFILLLLLLLFFFFFKNQDGKGSFPMKEEKSLDTNCAQ